MESTKEIKKESNTKDVKSRNPLKLENSIQLDFTSKDSDDYKKVRNPFPHISPLIATAIKSENVFATKRSQKRQDDLYQPYIKERDSMGRIIGSEVSNLNTLKPSPRQLLPSVFQFNKKWSVRQATKSNFQGNWENREISYAADVNYVFEKYENIPQTTKNLSQSIIKEESIMEKSTHATSGTNLLTTANHSMINSGSGSKTNFFMTPQASNLRNNSISGYRYFKMNDPK